MNIEILIPVAFSVLGAIVYLVAAHPKVAELGRVSFAMGLLTSLLVAANATLRLSA